MKKSTEYAAKITQKIAELIYNDDDELFIGLQELNKDDNLTEFIHAMATEAPCFLYNKLTGDDKNALEFNHLANQLVFQNVEVEK
jgi:hypothetical protein